MELKESKAVVEFRSPSWNEFEKITGDMGWKIKKHAARLIEKVTLASGIEIANTKLCAWIETLPAKDALLLLTKLNLNVKEVFDSLQDSEVGNVIANSSENLENTKKAEKSEN